MVSVEDVPTKVGNILMYTSFPINSPKLAAMNTHAFRQPQQHTSTQQQGEIKPKETEEYVTRYAALLNIHIMFCFHQQY